MSITEAVQVAGTCDLICNLKAAVTALECQHQMNMLKEQTEKKCKKPPPPPMFVMIPLEQSMNGSSDSDYDDRMKSKRHGCFNDSDSECTESLASSRSAKSHRREDGCRIAKGPGVRGGVLHSRCNCIHRDGLQDTCPLTECQNEPKCTIKPWAKCPPAKYFRGRFPDNYP